MAPSDPAFLPKTALPPLATVSMAARSSVLRFRNTAFADGSCIRLRAEHRNHVWSYDFVEDRTHEGRKYRIHASDGEIGHVADFLLEDGDWSIHYLVIDTQNWWPGKKVLISPRSIKSTDSSTRTMTLNVDRQKVKDSPAYDGSKAVDRAYEYKFHGYYDGRRVTEPV